MRIKRFKDIYENKQQAIKILKKYGETKLNYESYKKIYDLIKSKFNKLTYFGQMTKFFFEQKIAIEEIETLLEWLNKNRKKLPKNVLNYDTFEEINDDITKIENKIKSKKVYNLLPSNLKRKVSYIDIDFLERAVEIERLDILDDFKIKVSTIKDVDYLYVRMDEFIEYYSDDVSFYSLPIRLERYDTEIKFIDKEKKIIIAEIFDYEASKDLGSRNWCIQYSESRWRTYTRGGRKQYFIWDFSKKRSDSNYAIAFTTNSRGNIIHIHDKLGKNIIDKIPTKISEILNELELGQSKDEYKRNIMSLLNRGIGERADDSKNEDLIVVKLTNYKDILEYKGDLNYPYRDLSKNTPLKENKYFVFNFKYSLTSEYFLTFVTCRLLNDGNILYYLDNIGKIYTFTDKEVIKNEDFKRYVEFLEPYDNRMEMEELKNEYLNEIEKYTKNKEEAKKEHIKFIETSDDLKSTGNYWLFYVINFNAFKNNYIYNYNYDVVVKESVIRYNKYVLVDIDLGFDDPNFLKFIELSENGSNITKMFDTKSENLKENDLDEEIKDFISKGYMTIKKNQDYQKELNNKRNQIIRKSKEILESSERANEYARALFYYLTESENYLDIDDCPDLGDDTYKEVIILDYDQGGVICFNLINEFNFDRGYYSNLHCIGSSEEMEEHLIEDNFFNHSGEYDLIVEQTFFCAIHPEHRQAYAEKVHELLKPKGKLMGLLWSVELNEKHPPFGGSKEEYHNYFDPLFNFVHFGNSYNSIQPRSGRELFLLAEKK